MEEAQEYKPGAARSTYEKLRTDRDTYLKRARKCALLTIPSLVPETEDQHDKDRRDPYPYQSIGSRGVNNLAAKLLLTLFPPNSPFFRFQLSDTVEQELAVEAGVEEPDDLRMEFEKALQTAENIVQKDFEASQIRPSLFEFFKHLVVEGNCAIQDMGTGYRVFGLTHYVVRRDPAGSVLEAVIHEQVHPMALPDGFITEGDEAKGDLIDLYTHIIKSEKGWDVYQEALGKVVPETEGSYTVETMPFIFARMVKVDGADYGRSYVEELYGDLYSLETDSKSLTDIAQIAARLIVLVNPNGQTDEEDVRRADNGEIITGMEGDISMLQANVSFQIEALRKRIADLKSELAQSFLMNSSVQRDAERVTAAEIRYMADELEQALGGVYTILSQEVMYPLVKTRIASLKKKKTLVLPDKAVDLKIIVGVEALGRGHDLNRLRGWLQDVGAAAQVTPNILQRVNDGEILERLTAAHGLTSVDLIITQKEAAEAAQQEQQNQMVQQVAPEVAKETVKAVANGNSQQ